MIGLLTRNAGWKVFSLLVSVLLWFSFARDPEVGTFVAVPVEYRGMPDDLEISSDLVGSVSIDLRGPSGEIENFNAAKSAVGLGFFPIHQTRGATLHINTPQLHTPPEIPPRPPYPPPLRV